MKNKKYILIGFFIGILLNTYFINVFPEISTIITTRIESLKEVLLNIGTILFQAIGLGMILFILTILTFILIGVISNG